MSSHEALDTVQEQNSSKHMYREGKLSERQIAEHVSMNIIRGIKEIPPAKSQARRQAMIPFEYELINGEMCANGIPIRELLNPPEGRESNFPKLNQDVIDQLLKVQDIFANSPNAMQAFVPSSRDMYPGSDRNYLYRYQRSATNPNLIECVAIEHPGTAEEFRKFQEAILKMATNQVPGNNNGLNPAAILEKDYVIDGDTIFSLSKESIKNNPDSEKMNSYLEELRANMTNLDQIRHEEQKLIKELANVIEQAIIHQGEQGLDFIISKLQEEINEKGSPLQETINQIFESTKAELANIAVQVAEDKLKETLIAQTSQAIEQSIYDPDPLPINKRETEDKKDDPFKQQDPKLIDQAVNQVETTPEIHKVQQPQKQEIETASKIPKEIQDLEKKPILQRDMTEKEHATREAQIQRDRETREQIREAAMAQSNQRELAADTKTRTSSTPESLNIEDPRIFHPHEIMQANIELIKPSLEQAVEILETTSSEVRSFEFDKSFYDTLPEKLKVASEQDKSSSKQAKASFSTTSTKAKPEATVSFSATNTKIRPETTVRGKLGSPKRNLDFVLKNREKATVKSKSKQTNVKKVTLVQRVTEQAKKSMPVRVLALAFYSLPLGIRSALYKASRPLTATIRIVSKVAKSTLNSAVVIGKALLSAPKTLAKATINFIKRLAPKRILSAIAKTALLLRNKIRAIVYKIREGIKAVAKAIVRRIQAVAQRIRQVIDRVIKALNSTKLGKLLVKTISAITYFPRKIIKATREFFRSMIKTLKELIFGDRNKAKKAKDKSRRTILGIILEPVKVVSYLLASILTYPLYILFGKRFKDKKKAKKNKKLRRQELYDQLLMLLMKRAYVNAKNADEVRKQMLKEKLKRLLFLSKEELEEFIEMAALNEKEKHLLIEVLQMYNREIPDKYLAN